ncbi:Sodium/calcium exchanger protein-domain-containing protein [Lipomyces oligophaga]|uniref:Sodium/calcium exchanger protein-domain-containing protein n=1 Tax=Lipomyces oligophaga TaxID=45792 RepID=UPI0034CE69C4
MDPHSGSRRPSNPTHRSFSVEDAEVEFENDRVSSSGRQRASYSSRRRQRPRGERPSIAEVHFTDDPSVGATSTPVLESHIHVHHHHDQSAQSPAMPPSSGDLRPDEIDLSPPSENADLDGNESGSTLIHTASNEEDEFDDSDDTASIESFTLRERQDAINETHPFGIRIWKPALYKKSRSVQRIAETDIHSTPGKKVSWVVLLGNYVYSLVFGCPLWLITMAAVSICFIFLPWSSSAREYGRALYKLANYLIFPFGKFVQLDLDEHYAMEDEGEGRSVGEYEEWRSGEDRARLFFGPTRRRTRTRRPTTSSLDPINETDGLLGSSGDPNDGLSLVSSNSTSASGNPSSSASVDSLGSLESGSLYPHKRRLFGRGNWSLGRVVFYICFYLLVYPAMLFVAAVCWFTVFAIPMARVNFHLCSHLRRHPLALSFYPDNQFANTQQQVGSDHSILLCTYRAFGWNYYKYTVDGTNVFLMNLMFVVVFTIFDQYLIVKILGPSTFLTTPGVIFVLALSSVIPLAYFIGQAVASISAQSSMGMGAAINAFFSTIVEVFLYCVALTEGKGRLVEGSIIGSILAGVLVLPGISMCSGALKRKTQRYNPNSAGVSSTMLLFAVIAVFAPTLYYQIYGSYQLNCVPCTALEEPLGDATCRRCQFFLDPLTNDDFYRSSVKPFSYLCAILLFVSYCVGLWFTLRTHAAMIWQSSSAPVENPVAPVVIVNPNTTSADASRTSADPSATSLPMPFSRSASDVQVLPLVDLAGDTSTTSASGAGNASTSGVSAPTVIVPDDTKRLPIEVTMSPNSTVRRSSVKSSSRRSGGGSVKGSSVDPSQANASTGDIGAAATAGEDHATGGGHDAPNWSRFKSSVVLLGATVLYAVIAEILVDTVDVVLDSVSIDEKFLGITLFALVPNTTEFLNAISFAMNGNIALSMEIGSAYVLQVCLLQIPALILFSVYSSTVHDSLSDYSFTLVFPRWDLVVVVLCVFLLSYIYAEGRSNYFKGSILLLSYIVVMGGFWFSGQTNEARLSSLSSNSPSSGSIFYLPASYFI